MTAIWQFMKRNYKILLLVVALAAALWSFVPFKKSNDPDPEKEKFLLGVLNLVLQNAHYQPIEINDAFSERVFDNYLKIYDNNKRFLVKSDIDALTKYRTLLDDNFREQKIDFFNESYPIFQNRIKEAR